MQKYSLLTVLLAIFLLPACQEPRNNGHEGEDEHEEERSLSYTVWTEKCELFVEFKPLIVGENTRFTAHFSEMKNFKAIEKGTVTASLIQGKSGIRHTVDAPDSPGIFRPALQPKSAGIYALVFHIVTPNFSDEIVLENIEVFNNLDEANKKIPHEIENSNEISFLKEQAWKMEFANAPVIRDTVYNIIKTGGEILPAQGDEKTVSATANGILIYRKTGITVGAPVSSGQSLFTISGGGITSNNIQSDYLKAKSNYDQATKILERKEKLYASKSISKADYEAASLEFNLAETEFNNLSKNYSQGGKSVSSSSAGFIKKLYKSEGEFVDIGEPLAIVTQNKKLTIRADINQLDYSKLNQNMTANFLYNGAVYDISDLGGKLLSYGRSVSVENARIPVYFELNNRGDLLPGSFIEVWIKSNAKSKGLLIPKEALLEDYGQYSVIVQTSGEGFEKRNIQTGIYDGKFMEVLSGLEEGERVVTKGAYQVKMASMSGQAPAHGHAH
jgi:cobalt-zinc-cadmium efflux system membrane fusion protein